MITVIDSPCGRGKTTYAINLINENPTKNFIYIAPLLDQLNDVIDRTSTILGTTKKVKAPRLVQPYADRNTSETKTSTLIEYLNKNKDIASTHALFKKCTKELLEILKASHYTLILDEVMNVVESYPIKEDDLQRLIKSGGITIDKTGKITWTDVSTDDRYNDIQELAKSGLLYLVDNKVIMWTFPVNIFKAFDNVIICTYMFNAQIQRLYYDMFNVSYELKSVFNGELIDYAPEKDSVNKIHFLDDHKINTIGDGEYDLSWSWYRKHKSKLPALKANMYNFSHNIIPRAVNHGKMIKSDYIFWTTYEDFEKDLKGRGYSKRFLACNTRALNKYRHCYVVMYPINRFFNPEVKKFFQQHGVDINKKVEEEFALSEMIQFIWRSAIRDNKDIYVYIPSKRMRRLLNYYINEY